MKRKLHLDFETRSTLDLKKVGVHNYVTHPTTDVWCCCWAVGDGAVETWRPGKPLSPVLREVLEDLDAEVCGHHVAFEWYVIEYICAERYGWPAIAPERLNDTAARAAMHSLPRDLAGACKAVGSPVDKDDEGRRLMLRMAKPRKIHDDGTIEWWDVPERRLRLEQYCETDVEAERELDRRLLPLPDSEKTIWLLDFTINRRGVAIDMDLVRNADEVLKCSLKQYGERLSRVTDGAVTTATNHGALTKWLQSKGVDTDSVAKRTVEDLLERDDLPKAARKALKLRQESAKSSTAKLKSLALRVSEDGLMRDNLMYHGAGTGRWTAVGVQLQNIPRPTISKGDIALAIEIIKDPDLSVGAKVGQIEFLIGPVPTVISDCLRSVLVADKGNQLDVADFANIEGRVNACLAGQDDKVELFRNNGPIYERMAARIYGVPIESVTKDGIERYVGKSAELGCGYGMGPPKFVASCKDKGGVKIELSLAEQAVETFREVNNRIVAFWYNLEDAAIGAMRTPGVVSEYRGIQYLLPTPDMDGYGFLLCRLPSGRCLFYPQPELRWCKTPWGSDKEQLTYMGVDAYTRKWCRQKTYGGKLVENVVQATARDLLAAAMVRVERAGYRVVLTVHDEIIAESRKGYGSAEEFSRLMAKTPRWARGYPIAVEGYRAERYRK